MVLTPYLPTYVQLKLNAKFELKYFLSSAKGLRAKLIFNLFFKLKANSLLQANSMSRIGKWHCFCVKHFIEIYN